MPARGPRSAPPPQAYDSRPEVAKGTPKLLRGSSIVFSSLVRSVLRRLMVRARSTTERAATICTAHRTPCPPCLGYKYRPWFHHLLAFFRRCNCRAETEAKADAGAVHTITPRAAAAPSSHHRPAPYPTSANPSLTPSVNDQRAPASAWNDSDDDQLIRARQQGLAWQPIADTYFPSKTANACRKRHERLQERLKVEQWDGIKVEDLAKAYLEVREEMWKILASKVEEARWKVVEEKCMEKGLKNLLSAGRNAQRRSKSDPSAGDKDSDHDDPHDDSGIGGMEADPPDENGHSGSRPPMQSKGHHHPPSPPPPPPSHHHHHNSSGADYKISTNKSSNCTYHPVPSTSSMPQSATASSQPSFRPSLVMPSIASILQPVSLHSF